MDFSAHIATFTNFVLRILLYAGIGVAIIALIMLLFGSLRFVSRFPVVSMLIALLLLVGICYWLFPQKTVSALSNPRFYTPAFIAAGGLLLLGLLFRKRKPRSAASNRAFRGRAQNAGHQAYGAHAQGYAYEAEAEAEPEGERTYQHTYTQDTSQHAAPPVYSSEVLQLYAYFRLPAGAPFSEVKKAYISLQKQTHPDLYQDKPQSVLNQLNANAQEANANYARLKKLLDA